MNKTKIEWVKNPDGTQGYTWNPITGCLNHVNGKCKGGNFPCYAYRLAHGRLEGRYLQKPVMIDGVNLDCNFDPFYPRFWPERLPELEPGYTSKYKMLWNSRPIGVFVCDMSDLFGIGIPELWTQKILDVIRSQPWHRFYLLTKQPQNLIKFSPFPDNCWVGVTATSYYDLTVAESKLQRIKAGVKFISFEPLLSSVGHNNDWLYLHDAGINWLIIGAQTKPTVYPQIEWVQEIVEAADKAGIPVFLKDNLKPLMLSELHSTQEWGWREHKLRQELPE